MKFLTEDFKNKKWVDAIQDSAALCHYVGDAHVPVHVTANFNGQLSGNRGVHSRFESNLVQRYQDKMTFQSVTGAYVTDPVEYSFSAVLESFTHVSTILQADTFSRSTDSTFGNLYYSQFYNAVGKIAESRINQAGTATASLWYTAWVDAGKPELPVQPVKMPQQ